MTAPIRLPDFEGDVPLSTRTKNCLRTAWSVAGYTAPITPENISKLLTVRDLKRQPYFGNKSFDELSAWLGLYGFSLNTVPFGERLRIELEERAELARLKAKYEP